MRMPDTQEEAMAGDKVPRVVRRPKDLTEEERHRNDSLVRESMSKYLLYMYWKEPFFHRLLSAVHIHVDREQVPTAGVRIVDGRIDLIVNPDFLADLIDTNENWVIGLLQHEAYHLAYGHCFLDWQPHTVANWAQDLSINTSIPVDDLPPGGWVPGRRFDPIDPDDWKRMSQDERSWFDHMSDLVASLPPGMSAQWYFERLTSDSEIRRMLEREEELSKLGELLEEVLASDSHDQLEEIPEGDLQVAKGILATAIAEAVEEAARRGWGTVPRETQIQIRAMISRKVDWRSVLRLFVGQCRQHHLRTTWRRRSRKCPGQLPGHLRRRSSRIALFVDESGSMSDDDLALLVGELNSLSRLTTFDVYPFDTEVRVDAMVTWRRGMTVDSFPRVASGGTSFQCCVDFVHGRDVRDEYDGYLILTDGEACKPTPPPGRCLRRGYILTPGGKLYFEPDPSDLVVTMARSGA